MTKRITEQDVTYRNKTPLLLFGVGFLSVFLLGWLIFPALLYSNKKQPISFNHAIHAKLTDDGCETCHYFYQDGKFSGVPEIQTCKTCHFEVKKGSENEITLISDYIKVNKEIPWLIYSRQPDHVYFSHSAHVNFAEISCESCHGDVGKSSQPRIYQENKITGYSRDIWGRFMIKPGFMGRQTWESMRMADCADCHHKRGHKPTSVQTGKEGCFVCHK